MIGLDTNILVRFLVHDDEEQYGHVDRFFTERTVGDPAFVALVVVVLAAGTRRVGRGRRAFLPMALAVEVLVAVWLGINAVRDMGPWPDLTGP